mmetsp:Transcript_20510/g.54690  ORF Transcript_20510/g.54690 Transcript_20510/m.54690 type:complete len:200 (-) Transcript_20510:1268-1867(-)
MSSLKLQKWQFRINDMSANIRGELLNFVSHVEQLPSISPLAAVKVDSRNRYLNKPKPAHAHDLDVPVFGAEQVALQTRCLHLVLRVIKERPRTPRTEIPQRDIHVLRHPLLMQVCDNAAMHDAPRFFVNRLPQQMILLPPQILQESIHSLHALQPGRCLLEELGIRINQSPLVLMPSQNTVVRGVFLVHFASSFVDSGS